MAKCLSLRNCKSSHNPHYRKYAEHGGYFQGYPAPTVSSPLCAVLGSEGWRRKGATVGKAPGVIPSPGGIGSPCARRESGLIVTAITVVSERLVNRLATDYPPSLVNLFIMRMEF